MGKSIIQQARGHGSLTYRTSKRAFRVKISYPDPKEHGVAKVVKLLNITGYSSPLAKILFKGKIYYNFANQNLQEDQEIFIGQNPEIKDGNISLLKDLPIGTSVFNIESYLGGNGVFVRSGGTSAKIIKKDNNTVTLFLPSKQEKNFTPNLRATVGIIAGAGRKEKPFLKAGPVYLKMKARGGRIYPRTSAVKMNVVDHPFGSGRGKRIKSKIAKRNAPPGANVGHLRPRRTGKVK